MKQFVCEMCNSTDLIKQNGGFVCQYCKCKYSPEDAKKVMIDGTVHVEGNVGVEGIASYNMLIQNANTYLQLKDYDSAEKILETARQKAGLTIYTAH